MTLNLEQIDYMKHCIGFERRHVKRGKYEAYRNYFNNGDEMDGDWESLVEQGYAKQYTRFEQIIYCVTEDGMKLLEKILEIKIIKGS